MGVSADDMKMIGDLKKYLDQQQALPNILRESDFNQVRPLYSREMAASLSDAHLKELSYHLHSLVDPYKEIWVIRNDTPKGLTSLDEVKSYVIEELAPIFCPIASLDTTDPLARHAATAYAACVMQGSPVFQLSKTLYQYSECFNNRQTAPDEQTAHEQVRYRQATDRVREHFLAVRNLKMESTQRTSVGDAVSRRVDGSIPSQPASAGSAISMSASTVILED